MIFHIWLNTVTDKKEYSFCPPRLQRLFYLQLMYLLYNFFLLMIYLLDGLVQNKDAQVAASSRLVSISQVLLNNKYMNVYLLPHKN
jgi:hypothetical protein